MMREKRNSCRVFVWKALTKHPLGIPRNRWRDNIKMDFR
jgi:hypothetical protein